MLQLDYTRRILLSSYSNYNEDETIICNESGVNTLLHSIRQKKIEKRCEKFHNFSIGILFIFSTIILYIWKRDMQPIQYTSYEINYNYSFQRFFIPGFTMAQLMPVGLIRYFQSRLICIIFSAITFMALYTIGKYLFLDVGNSRLTFVLYIICLEMYFLFGLCIVFNRKMYSYMKSIKWSKWFVLYSSNKVIEKKLTIGTIIYFIGFMILF